MRAAGAAGGAGGAGGVGGVALEGRRGGVGAARELVDASRGKAGGNDLFGADVVGVREGRDGGPVGRGGGGGARCQSAQPTRRLRHVPVRCRQMGEVEEGAHFAGYKLEHAVQYVDVLLEPHFPVD